MIRPHESPEEPQAELSAQAEVAVVPTESSVAADRLLVFLETDQSIQHENLSINSLTQGPAIIGRFVLDELQQRIALARSQHRQFRPPRILVSSMVETTARELFGSNQPPELRDRYKLEGVQHAYEYQDRHAQIGMGFTLRAQLFEREHKKLAAVTSGLLAVYGICAHRLSQQRTVR